MAKIKIIEMIDKPALGGGQTAVLLLARGLDPQLFEVAVSSGSPGPLVDEAGRTGLRHIPFTPANRLSLRPAAAIARILEAEKAGILHTHGGYAGLYGRLAARRARTPVVVHTLHGIHYLHYRNPALRLFSIWQERFLSRMTDALVLVCQSDMARAKRHRLAPQDRLVAIPNGLDIGPGGSPPPAPDFGREFGLGSGGPVVGTVARLHRQKGIIHLLRAAPRILGAVPDARIVVVGEGPLGGELRRRAAALGLDGRLVFFGESQDAHSVMSLFDVFVLPSLWEGLPFVLVEAAWLGKPIVATAVDGVPEVIDDGKTGVLIPPGNAAALADAVISLLSDKRRAAEMAAAAKALIPPRFPLRRTVEQHQNLYLRLYRQKTGRGPEAP
jgi:glycosyltransferase involved in cell wall biosynthesis